MNEVWLSKLNPDEVGTPYIDIRAQRALFESIVHTASGAISQLNSILLGGDFAKASAITEQHLAQIKASTVFFSEKYKLDILREE